jgi:hypothetical protein
LKIHDIFKEWTSSIDLGKTQIVRFPSLIFLCGGPISEIPENFESCRDIFYKYINKSHYPFRDKVLLVEKVFSYFKHSVYQDLLSFERDLAELSALTVIFSESPGSIAELGALAVLKTVQERLLVVIHEDDADKESFIWRGPVLFLKDLAEANKKDNPITIYNWQRKNGKDDILKEQDFSDAEDLAELIATIISKIPKTKSFDKEQLGHVMLLILDLLKIIQLATLDEIVRCLNLLGIDHTRRTVEQQLSLLLSLNLAIKKAYRNNIYYLASPQKPWLSFGFLKTARVRDVDRWHARFIDHYSQNQKPKCRALRSIMKATGQIGD